jgi:hypothetical protein
MIRKSLTRYALLAALLSVSAASARTSFSNKNVLRHRSANSNLAMEYSASRQHLFAPQASSVRTHLMVSPFYQASQRGIDMGKYFGLGNGTNSLRIDDNRPDVTASSIIHDHDAAGAGAATIALSPEQHAYGARVDLFQDINSPVTGMFFRASTTAMQQQNNLKAVFSNTTDADATLKLNFEKYFAGQGNFGVAGAVQNQVGLEKAQIPGVRRSKVGLADIDVSLGYKCVHSATSHLFLSVDGTIPVGTRATGKYVFEPMIGNGRHFGLGASIDGGLEVWNNSVGSLHFNAAARYKYLFQNNEMRTLSLSGSGKTSYSKYQVVGQLNAPANTPLLPLANISTMNLAVRPGHQLDMLAAMSFNSGKFTVDVGYNPFWRDAESVRMHGDFDDTKYAIPLIDFDVTTQFTLADISNTITAASFDLASASTPSLLTHKLFMSTNYSWHIYGKSLMSVGVGASYEFASSNADVEQYAAWGKINVSF